MMNPHTQMPDANRIEINSLHKLAGAFLDWPAKQWQIIPRGAPNYLNATLCFFRLEDRPGHLKTQSIKPCSSSTIHRERHRLVPLRTFAHIRACCRETNGYYIFRTRKGDIDRCGLKAGDLGRMAELVARKRDCRITFCHNVATSHIFLSSSLQMDLA
jgi:hypothetical protein